jgi:hypothetical protein
MLKGTGISPLSSMSVAIAALILGGRVDRGHAADCDPDQTFN